MIVLSVNDFIQKHGLENKTTINIKMQRILSSLVLSDVGIYLRDGPFKTDIGIVNLHRFEGNHCVIYNHECYFDS